MSQSYFSKKMKGQAERGRQMDKITHIEGHTILSLTSHGGTKWYTNRIIDKSGRHKNIITNLI